MPTLNSATKHHDWQQLHLLYSYLQTLSYNLVSQDGPLPPA